MSQRYGVEQVGIVDPPFTLEIMAARYPAKFKMLSIPSYDGMTDADEHVENYQAHMLMQNATEAMMCKAFCLTLTGAARQWYRRLTPGSIASFSQLAEAFSKAFLNAKARKKESSYLFRVKQDRGEPLKRYLDRFDKAVLEVRTCPDDTLIQAF